MCRAVNIKLIPFDKFHIPLQKHIFNYFQCVPGTLHALRQYFRVYGVKSMIIYLYEMQIPAKSINSIGDIV